MAIVPLGNILDDAVKRAGIEQQVSAAQIMELFKNIAREKWGRVARERITPRYLRNKTLFIGVKDSVYSAELKLNEEEIVKELNQRYKKDAVKKLRILVE